MVAIDANGSVITPAIARQLAAAMSFGLGNLEQDDLWVEMHPMQSRAWETGGITVQLISDSENPNHEHLDTFMGWPLQLNMYLSAEVVLIRRNRTIVGKIVGLAVPMFSTEESHA